MKITITTQDLKNGRYLSNDNCPLAKALKRIFPNKDIWVGGYHIKLNERKYPFTSLQQRWVRSNVDLLIDKANIGEEVNYTINIPNLEAEL